MKNIVIKREPNYNPKKDAFPFQKKAFDFCKDREYSAIFYEQGLGKTKIGIDLLLYWLNFTDIDSVLIVTKKSLITNWRNEMLFHTHLHPRFLTPNRNDNFFIFNSPCKVIIINFESLSIEESRLKLFCKTRNVAIIIDESAKLKNPNSNLTKVFNNLSSCFAKRVIMTGTPAANRPYDIWSQIFFLDNGKSLGSDFANFKKKTDLPKSSLSKTNYPIILEEIFKKISEFTIRETKLSVQLNLPEKNFHDIWICFTPKQWALYKKIKDEMKVEIIREKNKIIDDSQQVLKRLLRLSQATSNPKLIDTNFNFKSAKEYELDRLVKQIISQNEKLIIWTNFVKNVDYFYEKYKEKYWAVRFYGNLSTLEKDNAVSNFKNGNAKIFIATPQSAKEGLTLTVANNAIFYDRGFSLDDYLQAQDRIHRISQNNECHIYNIMIKGSIDEWVNSLLLAKSKAAALSQNDINCNTFENSIDYSYVSIIKNILKSDEENLHGNE